MDSLGLAINVSKNTKNKKQKKWSTPLSERRRGMAEEIIGNGEIQPLHYGRGVLGMNLGGVF